MKHKARYVLFMMIIAQLDVLLIMTYMLLKPMPIYYSQYGFSRVEFQSPNSGDQTVSMMASMKGSISGICCCSAVVQDSELIIYPYCNLLLSTRREIRIHIGNVKLSSISVISRDKRKEVIWTEKIESEL